MQSILLLSIFVLTFSCTLALDGTLDRHWTLWKKTTNKHYSDVEEHIRRDVWESNLKKVREHNLQADLGVHTYYLGMNKYADKTIDEFVGVMNDYSVATEEQCSQDRDTFTFNPNLKLPATVDWRKKGYVTPVKDQGQCNLRWTFSTLGSLEGQHRRATGKLVSLSAQNLIDCARGGSMSCTGDSLEDISTYIFKNGGIDTENSYPYEGEPGPCRFNPATIGASMTSYSDITSRDENALQQAVSTIGPISVAIDANHSSFQLYQQGVYNEPLCSQTRLDRGVLVIGYGQESSQNYWLVKNSWGTSWGEEGYIKMVRNQKNQCGIATAAFYPVV